MSQFHPLTIAAWLTALSLSSCVSFKARPLNAARSAADLQGRTLHDAELRKFIAQNSTRVGAQGAGWGLGKLTLAALWLNPAVIVARAEVAAVEAGQITAGERPNPTLSLSPGYDTTSSGLSPWILTVGLEVPIETAGKRRWRGEEALRKAEAARLRLAATAWEVRGGVRKALVAVHSAEQSMALLEAQEKLQAETVRLLNLQREAGESSPFQATQARIALTQSQLALHDARKQSAVARAELAEAIGVPVSALADVTLDFTELEAARSVSLPRAKRTALTNRADILAALADYAAAESTLRLEIAKQYPDLHLGPGYELDQGDNKWSVGLSLELPLLNRNRGHIAEADAARELSAAKFLQVQAKALGEIERFHAQWNGARAKAEATRGLLEEQRKQVTATERMKQTGEIGGLDLVQRRLEANTSALLLQEAETQEREALGELEDALQAPASLPEVHWPKKNR
jgi:outer membrane protein TolC